MLDMRQRHTKQNMHNTVDIEKRSKKNWVMGIQYNRNIKGSKEVKKIFDKIFFYQ